MWLQIVHIWDKTPSKKFFFFFKEIAAYICHFVSTACSVIMFFAFHSEVEENQTPFKSDRQRLIGSNIGARNRASQQRALHNCNLVCSGSAVLDSPTVLR